MGEASEFATVLAAALAQLRRDGAPDVQLAAEPKLLKGGFWAEMWELSLLAETRAHLPARVVLRLAPDAQLAAWETTFQAGVAEQGFPTPTVRAWDFLPTASGRPWCVMDFAEGVPMLGGLSGVRALGAVPRLAKQLPQTLARVATELHQLDAEPLRAALSRAGLREPGVDAMLDNYWTRAKELGNPRVLGYVERLAATQPTSQETVLCHGDLHPFNVLITTTGYVVLDWTTGQITHPAYDLAYTHLLVSTPPLPVPMPLRPVLNAAAGKLADNFVTIYRKASPVAIDSDTFDWFRKLHACRILIDIEGWRADGTLDAHRDHPWFALEPTLIEHLG